MNLTMKIANIAIIAHIDHGKSTFCDALISICENIVQTTKSPSIDSHYIEKNRGVTIRNHYKELRFNDFIINLIDTPGHYDFKQYVNIGINISENIIVLIDISKGIQAQTIKYLDLANQLNKNITILLNKIDLNLNNKYKENIKSSIYNRWKIKNIFEISAKTQENIKEIMNKILNYSFYHKPELQSTELINKYDLKFIILDAFVNKYQYTTLSIYLLSGYIFKNQTILIDNTYYRIFKIFNIKHIEQEIESIHKYQIGNIMIMGNISNKFKNISGYKYQNKSLMPFVEKFELCLYCQIKPRKSDKFELLISQINKVILTEQNVEYTIIPHPIHIQVLQLAFYGLFHKEIFFDKLNLNKIDFQEIEFNHEFMYIDTKQKFYIIDFNLVNINYKKYLNNILTAFLNIRIQAPNNYFDILISKINIITSTTKILNSEFINNDFILSIQISEIDFLSKNFLSFIKNITNGHAEIIIDSKEFIKYNISILEVIINKHIVKELSKIIISDQQYEEADIYIEKLEQEISKQQYEIHIQIACNKRIIKSKIIKPYRKDVTSKCYGGDRTRKNKLLKKQSAGKNKLLKNFNIDKFKEKLFQ